MELDKNDEIYIIVELRLLKSSELSENKIIELFEEKILKLKNPSLSCYFASAFPDSKIEEHEQIVIDSKDLACCFNFANSVPKADVKKLGKVVVDSEDIEYNKKFLLGVDNCDKVAHINFLAEHDNYETLVDFLHSKRGSRLLPTDEATKRLSELFIETKDPYLNYEIASSLGINVDINKHAEAIVNGNDIWRNKSFYCLQFAQNIPGAPIEKLRQAVLKSREANGNYYFAKTIPCTDEEFNAHKKVVFSSDDEELKKLFRELIYERYPEEKYKGTIKKLTKYMNKFIEEE